MTGFVRAVAVTEGFLGHPVAGEPTLTAVDDARRSGLQMILLSDRPIDDLQDRDLQLMDHFDAVVAEHGAARAVRTGPVHREPGTVADALVEVLRELDVDPHDALGVSDGTAHLGLDVLEVSVVVDGLEDVDRRGHRTGSIGHGAGGIGHDTDYRLHGSGPATLQSLLDDTVHGWPMTSPARHDVWLRLAEGPSGPLGGSHVHVPGAHANVLLCAVGRHRQTVPLRLIRAWSAAGYTSLVLDFAGRYDERQLAGWGSRGTVVAPQGAGWPEELDVSLRALQPAVVLNLSVLDAAGSASSVRSRVVAEALAVAGRARARRGRPHWLVIDPVGPVLADPDLPPEALDLASRGHCLVLREHGGLPAGLREQVDAVVPCGPDCPLAG